MNKSRFAPATATLVSSQIGSGADRRGKNVVPASSVAVERREAPHPCVIGVRAPSPRRAAGRVMVRQGAPLRTRRLPALHFPRLRGNGKMGKGAPGALMEKSPGSVALAV